MYVFTREGYFSELLDMPFEQAERYVMRRMAHNKPRYRSLHGYGPEYRSIEYGAIDCNDKYRSTARLELRQPVTSLDNEWEECEEKDNFANWEQFIKEANIEGDDGEGYGYYQWPWPIPGE
jgi:hypothetical protein